MYRNTLFYILALGGQRLVCHGIYEKTRSDSVTDWILPTGGEGRKVCRKTEREDCEGVGNAATPEGDAENKICCRGKA
eukprot:125816-Amphidinium_carterae.2